uniref:Putative paramyosin n=1 Tax=Ixodes scapularis TaxID=6945 RepID=A0A4D5RYB5_IXOSC
MRLQFFIAVSFLALAVHVCSGRRQVNEGVTGFDFDQANLTTIKPFQDAPSDNDTQVTVIDTLRDISKTLKEKFIILGDKIKEKMNQLKQAAGDQAQKIKSQLNDLKQQLKDSVQALRKKVQGFFDKGQYASFGEEAIIIFGKLFNIRARLNEFIKGMKDITGDKLRQMAEAREAMKQKVQELFKPAQYASFGEHAMEIFAKLVNLREKLNKFLKDVKKVTGEKVDKLRELIKETREEIKKRILELMGSSNGASAQYQAIDADEDKTAYIVDTSQGYFKDPEREITDLGHKNCAENSRPEGSCQTACHSAQECNF